MSVRLNSGYWHLLPSGVGLWTSNVDLEHLNVAFIAAAIWRRSLERFVFDISNSLIF
jgi:hypothetical protein